MSKDRRDKAGGAEETESRSAPTGAVGADALFGASVNCEEAVHELYHYLDG